MKNIRLIAFLFNAIVSLVSAAGGNCILHAESKSIPFALSFRSDYKTDIVTSKDLLIGSAKIKLPFMEARAAAELYSKDNDQELRNNYGVALYTQKLFPKVPVVIMVGNLGLSGSISRLNSPQLSQVVGWTTNPVKVTFSKTALADYNSFTKPQALFAQIGLGDNKGFFKQTEINTFWNGQTLTSSFDLQLMLFKTIDLNLCMTGGIYPYDQSKQSPWYNSDLFYHQGNHFCCTTQLSLGTKNFSTMFMINTYESPMGKLDFVYRSESYIKFKRFSFNLSAFLNTNQKVLTSSQKELSPLLQIRSSGQYQFMAAGHAPLIIKTGFGAQADINLNCLEHSVKTNGGIQITGQKLNFYGAAKINLKLKNLENDLRFDFNSGSIESSVSGYIKNIKPEIKVKALFEPDSKKEKWTFSQKLGLNLNYNGPFDLKCGGNVNFVQKDGNNKMNYSGVVDVKVKIKFIDLEVKINLSGS